MRSPSPHPLKQEENSLQGTLGSRSDLLSEREFLYFLASLHPNPNLKKTEASSVLVNLDGAHPVFKNNAYVLYLILDKKRASSNVMRKTRAQSARRDLCSHLAREINKRVPDYFLFLSRRRKRACQSSLNFQQEKLCTSSPTRVASFLQSNETEESSISKIRQTGPSKTSRNKRFSLDKEILTIPFTSSTDGRERTLKKKGWSSPQLSNKNVWSSLQPSKRKRTPPPYARKQKESSPASCSR